MYSTISSVNHELIIPGGLTEDSVDVMRLVLLFENPFSLLLIQNKKKLTSTIFLKRVKDMRPASYVHTQWFQMEYQIWPKELVSPVR